MKHGLRDKTLRFVDEYLKTFNASEAYRKAGYKGKDPNVLGPQILANPKVQERIRAALKASEIDSRRVLKELVYLALSNPQDLFTNNQLKNISDLDETTARAISSIEVVELFEGRGEEKKKIGELKKIKFWDKPKALELIGRHLAMFVDRKEIEIKEVKPVKDLPDSELNKIISDDGEK